VLSLKKKPAEIYVKLRDRMNSLAFGYGPTDSGVEFSLLERFFTPEEAAYVLEMEIDKFFTADEYAKVSGRKVDTAEKILEDMALKGLIYRACPEGEKKSYRVVPVAHGFLEFGVDMVEKDIKEGKADWLQDYGAHAAEIWGKQWFGSTEVPFFRSVPINSNLVVENELLPFDDGAALIKSKKLFAVSKCLCRITTAASGGYDDPRKEVCLAFDDMARFYIDIGIGRELTMQEAIDLIEESVKLGLCLHVANSKEGEVMCSCAVDRCGLLQMTKTFGGPATAHVSHYKVEIDRSKCSGCGTCVTKCPTKCSSLDDAKKSVVSEPDRCVGCGQCVSNCPTGARSLVKKDDDEIIPLEETLFDAYEKMQALRKERGEI
jgi:electron transport complex protein RnfB